MHQHAEKATEHAAHEWIIPVLLGFPLLAGSADAPAGGRDHAEQHDDKAAEAQVAGLYEGFEIVVVEIEILHVIEHLVLHRDRAAEHPVSDACPHAGRLEQFQTQRPSAAAAAVRVRVDEVLRKEKADARAHKRDEHQKREPRR